MFKKIVVGLSLAMSQACWATDFFDGKYLKINKVMVAQKNYEGILIDLGVVYSNALVTIGNVISVNQGLATKDYDTYDVSTNQLQIPSVTYNDKNYTNVVVSLGDVLSISEFPVFVTRGCGTPNWDYIATLGNFTMSTNLWGIRGQNTWVKWLPNDFSMCIQGTYLKQGMQAIFEWNWPQEEYRDPNKPITKDFTTIHWTPGGRPMEPVNLSVCSIVLSHDINHTGFGNHQTFYDLYASKKSTPVTDVTSSTNGEDFNFSIRLFSSTGYIPNDGITDKSALIDGHNWIIRSQKNKFVQFMADKQDLLKGNIKLNKFIEYMKVNNLIDDVGSYYLHSIELGNEQIDGVGSLIINNFNVGN